MAPIFRATAPRPLLLLNAAHLLPMAPRASAKSALQIKEFPTSPWFPWRSEWMLPSFFLLSRWRGPSWGWPLRHLGVSEHPAVLQLPLPCAAAGRPGGFSAVCQCPCPSAPFHSEASQACQDQVPSVNFPLMLELIPPDSSRCLASRNSPLVGISEDQAGLFVAVLSKL